MRFKTDMTDVDEGSVFELVPQGVYPVRVNLVEDNHSQAGDPMPKVTFEIILGEHAGRMLFDRILFPEKGSKAEKILGRSKHFLHCIGEPHEDNFEVVTENWENRQCLAIVKHRDYESKTYANIVGYDFLDKDVKPETDGIPF